MAAASGLGLLAAALPRLSGGEVTAWAAVTALRAAALSFALGAAFLLDDPARHTTAAVPVRRGLRLALRWVPLVPFAALWWTAALLLVPEDARPRPGTSPWRRRRPSYSPWPARRSRCAGTARGRDRGRRAPARVRGPGAAAEPSRLGMFTEPADPHWAAAHDRWAVLLCALLVALAVSCAEPVRRRTLRALRSPSGTSNPSRG